MNKRCDLTLKLSSVISIMYNYWYDILKYFPYFSYVISKVITVNNYYPLVI